MYKYLGYNERLSILDKLNTMYAVKCIEDNYKVTSNVTNTFIYLKTMIEKNKKYEKYLNVINTLEIKSDCINSDIDEDDVLNVIEELLNLFKKSCDCIVLNSPKLKETILNQINLYDYMLKLNYLWNYLHVRNKVRYPEKINYNKLKINTLLYAFHIDMEPEYVTDKENINFIENILEGMGYKDRITIKEAETCDDYDLDKSFYYLETGGYIEEYKILLPIQNYKVWSEKEKKELQYMGYNVIVNNCDESVHIESFITYGGDLVILASEGDFINKKFISNFIELIEYCDETNNKYKKSTNLL